MRKKSKEPSKAEIAALVMKLFTQTAPVAVKKAFKKKKRKAR